MSNKIKINIPNYLDVSTSTLIKDIPRIISYNNEENLKFFNSFFCFNDNNAQSQNYIKTSLDTDGYVRAISGEFKNIKFDKVDASTLSSIITENTKINHKSTYNRFSNENTIQNEIFNNYCHDSKLIYHNVGSLYDKINNIDTSISENIIQINDISTKINSIQNQINTIYSNLDISKEYNLLSDKTDNLTAYSLRKTTNTINNTIATNNELYNNDIVLAYNNPTNSYTYPASVYNGTKNVKYQTDYDCIDILNNIKFRYYNVDSVYTKVNNQFINSLNCNNISLQTNILIDKSYDNDLIIKLYYDGEYYTCVKVLNNNIELCRMLLTCIDINEYGPKWYITSYSGNIEIIKIKKN